jgi:hypothetical protein
MGSFLPPGDWNVSIKPAPPPKKTQFDIFWLWLGVSIKKYGPVFFGLLIIFIFYQIGYYQGNIAEAMQNFPTFPTISCAGPPTTGPVQSIPGQKGYAVIVTQVNTEEEARRVIDRIKGTRILNPSFFVSNRQYIVYADDIMNQNQANTAVKKLENLGYFYPGPRILEQK